MHLDPAIRDWVMMPILLVMILVGLLRSNATILLQSKPKVDKWLVRESQALLRSARLRNVKILSCRKHGKDDGSCYGLDMVFCLTSFRILKDRFRDLAYTNLTSVDHFVSFDSILYRTNAC